MTLVQKTAFGYVVSETNQEMISNYFMYSVLPAIGLTALIVVVLVLLELWKLHINKKNRRK